MRNILNILVIFHIQENYFHIGIIYILFIKQKKHNNLMDMNKKVHFGIVYIQQMLHIYTYIIQHDHIIQYYSL